MKDEPHGSGMLDFSTMISANQSLRVELSDLRAALFKSLTERALDTLKLRDQAKEIENLRLELAWASRNAES